MDTKAKSVEELTAIIRDFDWGNFGLDEIEDIDSDDWAVALAREIANS